MVPPTLVIDRNIDSTSEATQKLEDFKNAVLYDELGNSIEFSTLYENRKIILIFIRNFLCFMTTDYVRDLAKIPEDYLKESDVHLVVIGCAHWKFIKEFRDVTGYKHELYCDPYRYLYTNLGMISEERKLVRNNAHHHTPSLLGIAHSMWRAMISQEYQGDIAQNGGAFVVESGGQVQYSHMDAGSSDSAPINKLLSVAGVQTVNFTDSRGGKTNSSGRILHL